MAYNKLNKLLYYRDVLALTQKYFNPKISTYSGIYREYIYPIYKMEYKTYMNIVNFENLEGKIAELKKQEESNNTKNETGLIE